MSQIERLSWPTTSPDLLAALSNVGNSLQWEQFDQRYGELLRIFCRQKGLQDADAEDVTQHVFLEVARSIGRFTYDETRGKFRAWLTVVTQRAIWKVWQRRQRIREISLDDVHHLAMASSVDCAFDFQEAILDLAAQQIRGEFTKEEWTVYEQGCRSEVPSSDIATVLNRSISWVYQAKSRILKRLRQQVELLCNDIAHPPQF